MANISSSVAALRALSALLLKKLLQPIMVLVVIVVASVYLLTIFLALSFSDWWWLLLVIWLPLTMMLLAVGYVIWFLVETLLPKKLSKTEKKTISDYTDKLVNLAEKSRTPYPVILFLIAKDVVRGKESAFLSGMIGDSKSLVRGFTDVQEIFKK